MMRLLHGDCREVMRELPENSVDAIVTDPPYGLEFMGRDWDKLDGDDAPGYAEKLRMTPDHMGKGFKALPNFYMAGPKMQSWHESWAREAYRVLKPGGHLLAFGGSRTYHRLACAVEDAGFEVRDQLQYLYGSGFPKSHNLHGEWDGWGTALKPAHEPIVLARKPLCGTVAANVSEHGTGALNIAQTRITSDDGSDLTPYPVLASLSSVLDAVPRIAAALRSCSTSDIDLVRNALGLGDTLPPVAQDVGSPHSASANGHARHWTAVQDSLGDCPACRRFGDALTRRVQEAAQVGAPSLADALADIASELPTQLRSRDCQCIGHPSTADALRQFSSLLNLLRKYTATGIERPGRWPSNVILGHSPECREVGVKRVKGSNRPGPATAGAFGRNGVYGAAEGGLHPSTFADPDGYETVTAWECAPDCAVALLDAQSGERKSGRLEPHHKRYSARLGQNTYGDDDGGEFATNGRSYGGDSGGPSRFFYTAKASRAERNAGLEGMPEHDSAHIRDKAVRECVVCGSRHRSPLRWPACDHDNWAWVAQNDNGHKGGRVINHHPTVKPIAVMRWLCRLITPPGGTVLDPFLGSGTTGIAAVLEGFDFIGIEQSDEYLEIARRRIAHVEKHGENWLKAGAAPRVRMSDGVYAGGKGYDWLRRCPEHDEVTDMSLRPIRYQCGCPRVSATPKECIEQAEERATDYSRLPLFAQAAD